MSKVGDDLASIGRVKKTSRHLVDRREIRVLGGHGGPGTRAYKKHTKSLGFFRKTCGLRLRRKPGKISLFLLGKEELL